MPNPITGTLVRTVPQYPFPGYSPAYVPANGSAVCDDTGDVFYFMVSVYPGEMFIGKYVYSTDTLSKLVTVDTSPGADPYRLAWNAAKDGFIVWSTGFPISFFTVDLATLIVIPIGEILVGRVIRDLRWDVTLGYVCPGYGAGRHNFGVLDLAALTHTRFAWFDSSNWTCELDGNFVYGQQTVSMPGSGPLYRLHRAKGYMREFLAGSKNGQTAIADHNPNYFKSRLFTLEMALRGDSLYLVAQDAADAPYLFAYDVASRAVERLTPVVSDLSGMAVSPNGDRVMICGNSLGLFFYT